MSALPAERGGEVPVRAIKFSKLSGRCARTLKARSLPAAQSLELPVPRIPASVLAMALFAGLLCPANAATKRIKVPNQYDGSWTIAAATAEGPCSASTSYRVQITNRGASIPGGEIDVEGGVSASGVVRATITKDSNRVAITGRLNVKGNGTGTWRTSGGLVECAGNWSAKRAG